jgi:hypothetical protein
MKTRSNTMSQSSQLIYQEISGFRIIEHLFFPDSAQIAAEDTAV